MTNSKLIAVSGPPGCGKTTLALKIAQELYQSTKGMVVYLSPDTMIPALGQIFPKRDKDDLKSLGKALEKINLLYEDILGVIATAGNMANMGYLGYIPGESAYTYAALQESKIIEMFNVLRDNFDYIVVDCDRYRDDLISSIACGLSDHLIQIVNPDIKSIAYYGFEPIRDRAIQVMVMLDKDVYLPVQETKDYFPHIEYTFPYSRALKLQMLEGQLTEIPKDKTFRKLLRPLVDKLMEVPELEAVAADTLPDVEGDQLQEEAQSVTAEDEFWK